MIFFKIFFPILFFIVGTIFASFGNMLMYRYANDKPIVKDTRSYCPKCNHQIAWYDNIPLISFLVLKGKCRYCKKPISKRYFIVELYGGISFLIIYFLYVCLLPNKSFDLSMNILDFTKAVTISFTLLFLLIAAYVDSKKKEIPFSMMICMLIMAIINFVIDAIVNKHVTWNYLIGLGIPIVIFLLIYFIGRVIFKKEAFGLGDVIVFSILGFLFGAINLISIVLFSSVICSIVELIKIKKTKEKKEIPFVPYIFIGTLITALFTPYIIEAINILIGGF